MDQYQIQSEAELEAALSSEGFLLFKHSDRCSISVEAFRAYGAFVRQNPTIRHGWIDVVRQKPWPQLVAQRTGIAHASPQALWLIGGRPAWHANLFQITPAAIREGIRGDASDETG